MGHVYILSADRYWDGKNLVKIGMTDRPNVYDRFNEIASEWMDDRGISINLYHSAKVTNPTAVETALHREFKRPVRLYNKDIWAEFGSKCGGDSEWFAMDDRQLQQAVQSLNSYRSVPWLDTDRIPWLGIIGTTIGLLSIGWLLGSILLKTPTRVPLRKAIVTSDVNVRSGPDKSYSIAKDGKGEDLKSLKTGTTIDVYDTHLGWVEISPGRWVAGNYTAKVTAKKTGEF